MDPRLKENLEKVNNKWGYLSMDNLLNNLFDLRFQLLHLTNVDRREINIDSSEIYEKFKKLNFNYTVKR